MRCVQISHYHLYHFEIVTLLHLTYYNSLKFKSFLDIRALKHKFILCCVDLNTINFTLKRGGGESHLNLQLQNEYEFLLETDFTLKKMDPYN